MNNPLNDPTPLIVCYMMVTVTVRRLRSRYIYWPECGPRYSESDSVRNISVLEWRTVYSFFVRWSKKWASSFKWPTELWNEPTFKKISNHKTVNTLKEFSQSSLNCRVALIETHTPRTTWRPRTETSLAVWITSKPLEVRGAIEPTVRIYDCVIQRR